MNAILFLSLERVIMMQLRSLVSRSLDFTYITTSRALPSYQLSVTYLIKSRINHTDEHGENKKEEHIRLCLKSLFWVILSAVHNVTGVFRIIASR